MGSPTTGKHQYRGRSPAQVRATLNSLAVTNGTDQQWDYQTTANISTGTLSQLGCGYAEFTGRGPTGLTSNGITNNGNISTGGPLSSSGAATLNSLAVDQRPDQQWDHQQWATSVPGTLSSSGCCDLETRQTISKRTDE